MYTYQGFVKKENERYLVFCNGEKLNYHTEIVSHSPTGFSWGYPGSGPSQLALALMVNEFGKDIEQHPVSYQDLKNELIVCLDSEQDFTITSKDIKRSVTIIQTNSQLLHQNTN